MFYRESGILYDLRKIWTRDSGVLYQVFNRGFTISIDSDRTDFTGPQVLAALVTAGWNGTDAIDATLVLNDAYCRATSTGNAALVVPALPVGSTFTIIQVGIKQFQGKGGQSGNGGNGGLGTNGSAGGPAISILMDVIIVSVFIFAGGGGAAGGVSTSDSCPVGKGTDSCSQGGGGGGGGAGGGGGGPGFGSPSNNGSAGSTTLTSAANGVGGPGRTTTCCGNDHTSEAGANGGDWGAVGGSTAGRTGGAAGLAIQKNGFNVTFLSGNDGTHIKGAVS